MPNFGELYRTYTETELMDAFSTRYQYTPKARAAMMLVINERGLSEAAEKEIARQHAAEAAAQSAALKQFEETFRIDMKNENQLKSETFQLTYCLRYCS
jgi:hypothetical protein